MESIKLRTTEKRKEYGQKGVSATECERYAEGYYQGATDQKQIDMEKAKNAFDEFIDYLHESGRITLDESEDRTMWYGVFVGFLK